MKTIAKKADSKKVNTKKDMPVFFPRITCKPCSKKFAKEKKIKRIVAVGSNGITNSISFSYENNVVKKIKQSYGGDVVRYVFYYIDPNCHLSGFDAQLFREEPRTEALYLSSSFTYDGSKLLRRMLDKQESRRSDIPFAGFDNEYNFNALGQLTQDFPFTEELDYGNDIVMKYNYSGNNLSRSWLSTGETENISEIYYDNKKNPFRFQENFLYHVKILPFATRYRYNDLFKSTNSFFGLLLNANNPVRFRFDDILEGEISQFTFEYIYDSSGHPTTIRVYRAEYTGGGFGDRVPVEKIRISYF